MRRYALKDDQWEKIEPHLPGRKGRVSRATQDNRLFVEAVLYCCLAGIPWRDLPVRFGDFRVVHTWFTRWSRSGVWERIFKYLADYTDNVDPCPHAVYAMIDTWLRCDLSDNPQFQGNYTQALQSITAKALVMPATTDLSFHSRRLSS